MYSLLVQKSPALQGSVWVSSAKNAVLPIMAAAVLADTVIIEDVPRLQDVFVMNGILTLLGAKIQARGGALHIDASNICRFEAVEPPVRKLRASVLLLGPMLARFGRVKLALPGGCNIGSRPVDLHIHGLCALGADIRVRGGVIEAQANGLHGESVALPFPSVGATENLMMAACLAKGRTRIINAAMEPEICDLGNFLRGMGARIYGDGTSVVEIDGVRRLHPTSHRPIPDRIEAGTIMIASAISGGDVLLHNVMPSHLRPVSKKLLEAGAMVLEGYRCVRVMGPPRLAPISVCARPHPGYPTDLQAQIMALACMAQGESCIEETVFENRFLHIAELQKMGASIEIDGCTARIAGGCSLHGAQVSATDLRGGAALTLAGLCAYGPTRIENTYNIDRGYEGLDLKLCSLGAQIKRIRENGDCFSGADELS